jgi:tetraprenyl-beta-curcumene synthase
MQGALALLRVNVRYWATVAPVVRRELARWQPRAEAIPDPAMRAIALRKLDEERFNAEAAGMLATLAPRSHRVNVVRAIVAMEVLYDVLDGLTELPLDEPLREGEELYLAFTDALTTTAAEGPNEYLRELSTVARSAFAQLPAADAVRERARESAARAAQAQIHMHAAPRLGDAQLREWAQVQSHATSLSWRELLAGAASSVLAVHALIALAAVPAATVERATELDACYLSIGVLLTLLDGVADQDKDAISGEVAYVDLFEDRELLSGTLAAAARRARHAAQELPDAPDHLVILSGVVAYYASTPGSSKLLLTELEHELGPLLRLTLPVMHVWRRARRSRGQEC